MTVLVAVTCGTPAVPSELPLSTTPIAGAIHGKPFRPAQSVVLDGKHGLSLAFYDEAMPKPCSDSKAEIPRNGFQIGLGRDVRLATGLDITQRGRAPEGPLGIPHANYFRRNPEHATNPRVIGSLGYGGGSYRVVIDSIDRTTRGVRGRVTIGWFAFDAAELHGAFEAVYCEVR